MAAAAEPVAETVLEATVATMRKIHLCKQAHQSAGAAHDAASREHAALLTSDRSPPALRLRFKSGPTIRQTSVIT